MDMINARHLGEVREPDRAGWRALRFRLFKKWDGLRLDAVALLVNVGGKEPEALVFELERLRVLGDATLAEEDRLPALGQRPADDGPFFQCAFQHRKTEARLVN